MKKWRIWLLIILIILAITGGNFAYGYLTAIQRINVTILGGEVASVEGDGNPAWNLLGQGGNLPTTTLYRITPSVNYTGNLLVLLWLTNYGELRPVYQHLNMKVELLDKDGVGVGRIEFLTLESTFTFFVLNYGTGWNSPYWVKITGGSFNISKETAGSGESFSPLFFVKAVPR